MGKGLNIIKKLDKTALIEINPTLLDILFSNLLINAIKHNIKNGMIYIMLTSEKLTVENTGKPLENKPNVFFGRFRKHNTESDSLGLGLAIVQKICDTNHLKIDYIFQNNLHIIEITF